MTIVIITKIHRKIFAIFCEKDSKNNLTFRIPKTLSYRDTSSPLTDRYYTPIKLIYLKDRKKDYTYLRS